MYTILHLETSKVYTKLLSTICRELGMDYLSTSNIDEAMTILENDTIDLIITAMELQGGNAQQFVLEVNATAYKNIPIVVITGSESYEARKSMYDLGIVDYILKTASPDEIKNSIKTYVHDDEIIHDISEMTIAVCDDSYMDRYIIERIFTMYNFNKVDYYDDGQKLLDSPKEYDIYIVDLVLETISGRNVITRLRASKKDIVIISISGMDNPKVITNVLSAGADDYITKPFNNEIFISRLKTNVRSYLLLKKLEEKNVLLSQMAISDGLTGLYNHKYIIERLKNEIEAAKRYKHTLSIIMFDIDNFKSINDNYGHLFGDEVLRAVATVVTDTVRESDVAGRYGGEEFLIVLPNTDQGNAVTLAERIREAIEKIKTGEADCRITISAGVKQFEDENVNGLIKCTDDLLYKAKENGRNRIESA